MLKLIEHKPHPFTRDQVIGMLQNPFYAGWATHIGRRLKRRHGLEVRAPGLHEPIITQEVYEAAERVRMQRNHVPVGKSLRRTHTNLAAELVRCVACGQPMRVDVVRFVDRARDRGLDCTARRRTLRVAVIDEAIAEAVGLLRLPADWREVGLAGVGLADAEVDYERRRNQLERELWRAQDLLCAASSTRSGSRRGVVRSRPSWPDCGWRRARSM